MRLTEPVFVDDYRRHRATGSFVLIDEATHQTVAAGMIRLDGGVDRRSDDRRHGAAVWHAPAVGRSSAGRATGCAGATVWFTGLSGSGKSTLANAVAQRLLEAGRAAYVLDGDNLRHGLNADLGYSPADRTENVRRVGEVARLLTDAGLVALVPVISPYRADRDRVRDAHAVDGLPFVEVFVDTPLAVCEARDPKGLYAAPAPVS